MALDLKPWSGTAPSRRSMCTLGRERHPDSSPLYFIFSSLIVQCFHVSSVMHPISYGYEKWLCFMGNYPILGDTCCRLISLVLDKERNTITEVWERLLDEQHGHKENKNPGKSQTIPKKPMKGPGVSKDSVKPTPMKSKPAKKATTWQKAWGWKSPTMKPIFLLSFYDNNMYQKAKKCLYLVHCMGPSLHWSTWPKVLAK